MNKLYINGCSFTKGNQLEFEHTWPYLLSKATGLELYNYSANANSLDTITTSTILHLSKLDPEETIAVIGLTWPTRMGVMYDDMMFNVTLGDTEGRNKNWYHRVFGDRMTLLFDLDRDRQKRKAFEDRIRESQIEPYEDVATSYANIFTNIINTDPNYERTLNIKALVNILNLQNYLKVNNYRYKLIDFQDLDSLYNKPQELSLLAQIDRENVISINPKPFGMEHSHPSSNACEFISKIIKDKL